MKHHLSLSRRQFLQHSALAASGLAWMAAPAFVPSTIAAEAQRCRAEAQTDRLRITIGSQPFTEYLFSDQEKYPYFYPVIGPRSARSVTTRRDQEYPHHSSIFFGCDRVNGGNYWQEGLDRGRIVHKNLKLIQSEGPEIVFEQECRWERPGAEAPFDDIRRIAMSAPTADRRVIDFTITLKARIKVRIEKTNHSLFAVRMSPDLSVKSGGSMINAQGDLNEKGTFGKPSPWMDYRGNREPVVEGIALLDHPKNPWSPSPWFTRDYGFFSPTPFNWLPNGFLEMSAGESLAFRYRVIIHADQPSRAQLAEEYQRWAAP